MEVFKGKTFLRLEENKKKGLISDVRILKKNHGTVVESVNYKKGDKLIFFSRGVIVDDKLMIEDNEVILKIMKDKNELQYDRILVESELGPEKVGLIETSEAHREVLPVGKVLSIGKDVNKVKEGERVWFDMQQAVTAIPYNIPGIPDKNVFLIRERDLISIL